MWRDAIELDDMLHRQLKEFFGLATFALDGNDVEIFDLSEQN